MRISADQLKADLAAIIDPTLAARLVDQYLEMQQRYYAGDWKPSELDGGQFCEAVVRALYEVDTGGTTALGVGEICDELRKKNPPPTHALHEKDRRHFCQIVQAIYKFRNDRNIAHISLVPDHDANLMDATLIVQVVKWLFCEFLRLAQKLDRDKVLAVIESIIQLEHPLIHELDGRPMVMHTGLTVGEEILLLLQHAPQGRLTKQQLREWVPSTPQAVTMAITRLKALRHVRESESAEIVITPPGQARVQHEILPKTATNPRTPASARITTRRKTSNRTKSTRIRSQKKAP